MSISSAHFKILITGCSSGIGFTTAENLQKRGYQVVATVKKTSDITKLKDYGFKHVIQLDLADINSIRVAFEQTMEIFNGELYALFNNGAYGQPGYIEDLPTDALREQFEVNFFGWHELTRLGIPIFKKQGFGRIIQNSSVLGLVGLKNRAAYVASKFALEGYSDVLRLELKDTNIKVILIEPGPIATKFRKNAYAMFLKNIDYKNSVNHELYQKAIERFESGKADPFTLQSQDVYSFILCALEKKKPKERYYITVPTHLFACFKRVLSTKWLDKILNRY